jgi:hypothetical protein
MGNKIITEKDFWICTGGTTPAQLQSGQTPQLVKKESGHKYITVADTATSSWIDFGCRKLMWIMAILAAVIAVAVVATGGAALGALIAAGAIAGAAGAAFGAVVGALICGQKAAAARKWLNNKPDMIIKGQRAITGDDQMKCMLFGETIAFAPQIKNWWQAISLGASNYISGIMEGMMWGAAIGVTGGVISGGPAVLAEFGFSNLGANWLATWGGWGLGLRGAVTAQSVLGAYGERGEVSAGDVIWDGVFGLETGTLHSAQRILTGNGTMTDVIGVGLWFIPAHGRSQKSRTISEESRTKSEEGRSEESKNEESKNEENPQARGNESKAPRRQGEFEAFEEGKGKPWEEGRNPYRYQRYTRQFRRNHPNQEPLGPEEWWNKHGKKTPNNPGGGEGRADHRAKVAELRKTAEAEYPDGRYEIRSNESVPGLRQKPDVAVIDTQTGQVVKIYEAARFNKSGGLIRPDERAKIPDYEAAGIPYEFHPVGPNQPPGGVLRSSP